MFEFEFIIMRQGESGRWALHQRLDADRTGEDVKEVAIKVAQGYRARVTVLGADSFGVQTLWVLDETGKRVK